MESKNERKMLSEMIEVNDGLRALCTKLANLRSNIEKDYKDSIPANAYKIILNSTVSTEIIGFLTLLGMHADKYLECIGVEKNAKG